MMTIISCCHNSSSVEYTFLTFPLLQIHYDTLIRHENFQFFNWFPFFGISYYHFIIEQSAPNCSKWVYMFHKFSGGTPLQDIFRFLIATHSHAWLMYSLIESFAIIIVILSPVCALLSSSVQYTTKFLVKAYPWRHVQVPESKMILTDRKICFDCYDIIFRMCLVILSKWK